MRRRKCILVVSGRLVSAPKSGDGMQCWLRGVIAVVRHSARPRGRKSHSLKSDAQFLLNEYAVDVIVL